MYEICIPPFGQTPECFTHFSDEMISTTACAEAYARMFGIVDIANLYNIANTVGAIRDTCSAITSRV